MLTLDQKNQLKKEREKDVIANLMKAFLPLDPLIAAAIAFIVIETVRISKYSKLNSFLFFKKSKNKLSAKFPQKICSNCITKAGIYKN